MNFDNFFKNILGFPRRNPSDEQKQFPSGDDEETEIRDDFQQRFNNEVEAMMAHFETHFENMFKGFMDFGANVESHGFLEPPPDAPLRDRFLKGDERTQEIPTPRDKMLKNPDSERQLTIPNGEPSFERPQGWFSGLFNRRPVVDKDLDDVVLSQGIDHLLKQQPSEMEPTFKSGGYFNKTTVTVFSSDGKGEQRYSERDQYGNEINVVIRTLGDKQHHFTIKKNDEGTTREENFVNLDEENLEEFNKNFYSSNRQHCPNDRLGDFPLSDPSAPGIYQRLFGNLLPPPKNKN